MEGQAGHTSERTQREKKVSHEHVKMDVQDPKEPEECGAKRFDKGAQDLTIKERQISGKSQTEPEPGEESFHPAFVVCLPEDRWGIRGEQESIHDLLSDPCCPAEGSIHQTSPISMLEYWVYIDHENNMADCPIIRAIAPPASPVTHSPVVQSKVSGPVADTDRLSNVACGPASSVWSPGCFEQDPVGAAAHLHLLGESLSLIGHHLRGTNKLVSVSGSMSLLLDSLLCALAPLICLTAEVPELRSCTQNTRASTLENISYMMPGM
ncbi:HMG box-containing protein 4-like [Brachionichthys hirsutus]|uniref:HMG box-containing protein 4-like n=1 Tax=Brachionichthys hirsutus TaxID=412623 RepID=UPI003604D093